MALQKTINYKGLAFDGYIKVVHVNGNKSRLYFNVEYYASKDIAEADVDNQNFLWVSPMYNIVPDLGSEDNFIKQMYAHLKTLPEFADAVDV